MRCKERNWLHGHFEGYAGATWYDSPSESNQCGNLLYSISTKTDWVVACGRNIQTAGSTGTIINGVVTSVAKGGAGNCELTINLDPYLYSQPTDWQLSKVYVWNTHLPNAVFADASARLNSYLAGAATVRILALSLFKSTYIYIYMFVCVCIISLSCCEVHECPC